jgi:hypothetical protein
LEARLALDDRNPIDHESVFATEVRMKLVIRYVAALTCCVLLTAMILLLGTLGLLIGFFNIWSFLVGSLLSVFRRFFFLLLRRLLFLLSRWLGFVLARFRCFRPGLRRFRLGVLILGTDYGSATEQNHQACRAH